MRRFRYLAAATVIAGLVAGLNLGTAGTLLRS